MLGDSAGGATLPMTYEIRPAVASDQPFLWQMLYYAAHMDEGGESLDPLTAIHCWHHTSKATAVPATSA